VMKKMKIEKIELPTEQFKNTPQLQHIDNKIAISEYFGEHKTLYQLLITLEPKDILKLMTWLIGQEKHTQEELTSLRKKVKENQKNELSRKPIQSSWVPEINVLSDNKLANGEFRMYKQKR